MQKPTGNDQCRYYQLCQHRIKSIETESAIVGVIYATLRACLTFVRSSGLDDVVECGMLCCGVNPNLPHLF